MTELFLRFNAGKFEVVELRDGYMFRWIASADTVQDVLVQASYILPNLMLPLMTQP